MATCKVLVVNPVAGGGRANRFVTKARRFLEQHGQTCIVLETAYPGHAEQLARAHVSQGTVIVALGGDGTVNEVMRGVAGSPSPMAILPCGSGNDIASSFGIYRKNALRILLEDSSQSCDVGMVNDQPFLGVASCGLDTEVNRIANTLPRFLKGFMLYTFSLMLALFRYRAIEILLSTPKGDFKEKIMLMAVGHGDRYGGGMKITPLAKREDGLLDLCIVREISKWSLIGLFPRVFSGKHIHHPMVSYMQLDSLSIEGKSEIYADGEKKTYLPARYHIKPGFLQIVLPKT